MEARVAGSGMVSMAAEKEEQVRINEVLNYGGESSQCLQKFKLYETCSNFYMIGRDKSRTCWKVLKINRLEQSELSIIEDPTTYSEIECYDLLSRIHEGNRSSGGLKFVTTCYGIVGFIKFLGPYYMILITKRRKIGMICGHSVYSIAKNEMIPIPTSTIHSNMDYARNENRYKKLLRTVDLTKNFYFSYSYHIMLSLQKNQSNPESKLIVDETMFVWNEFLTRGIRSQLKKTSWTVALVYGFFKQVRLSVSGREFDLILVARRSRHYAGMRYLKRGVNDKGRVANDVETEQIVVEYIQERSSLQISSVVQHRGSIPLFWSQETSRLNIKPDITLSKKDDKYEATKLHFENLVKRYGNPIIILNLIKTREKKPRESILRSEFANAIEVINKDLSPEHHLKFLHWDLSKYSRNKAVCVLAYLVKVAGNALDLTGFFYCQVLHSSWKLSCNDCGNSNCMNENTHHMTKDAHSLDTKDCVKHGDVGRGHIFKPPMFQKGVLRTNCIDCLDRTNVAQYAYGLVSLGHQLRALGYIDVPRIDLDSPLADDLMKIYEAMGDTLALQYGGSAAHNKIFSERRGQWKAATQSQEIFRTLQRYYSNAYMDAEKQDAINVFLGHFQPQHGKPALWELDSDQHYGVGRRGFNFSEENSRPMIKRSFSDGNILCDSKSPILDENVVQIDSSHRPLPVKVQVCNRGFPESTPEISPCESDVSYSRYTPSMPGRELFPDTTYLENSSLCFAGHGGDSFNCSNFLGADWLSSSANSCEDDSYGVIGSPSPGNSMDEIIKVDRSSSQLSASSSKGKELASGDLSDGAGGSYSSVPGFSERFVQWVRHGDILFP